MQFMCVYIDLRLCYTGGNGEIKIWVTSKHTFKPTFAMLSQTSKIVSCIISLSPSYYKKILGRRRIASIVMTPQLLTGRLWCTCKNKTKTERDNFAFLFKTTVKCRSWLPYENMIDKLIFSLLSGLSLRLFYQLQFCC